MTSAPQSIHPIAEPVRKPVRVQRRRTKGWKMPENTVSVTRPGKWGNPYYPGCGHGYGGFDAKGDMICADVSDPRVQVKWFGWKMEELQQHFPDEFESYIAPLRGKNLACWCKLGDACHADVLLELANTGQPK
jgi:hypothetical protein